MANADTPLKRYSVMNLASPWRGLNVVPQAAIDDDERTAVMYLYSGITGGAAAAETTTSKLVMPDFDDGGVERRRRKRKAEVAALERMAQITPPVVDEPPAVPVALAPPQPEPVVPRVRKPVDSKLATAIAGKLKPVEIVAAKVETMQVEQQQRMAQIQKRRQQEKEDEDALFRLGVFD